MYSFAFGGGEAANVETAEAAATEAEAEGEETKVTGATTGTTGIVGGAATGVVTNEGATPPLSIGPFSKRAGVVSDTGFLINPSIALGFLSSTPDTGEVTVVALSALAGGSAARLATDFLTGLTVRFAMAGLAGVTVGAAVGVAPFTESVVGVTLEFTPGGFVGFAVAFAFAAGAAAPPTFEVAFVLDFVAGFFPRGFGFAEEIFFGV